MKIKPIEIFCAAGAFRESIPYERYRRAGGISYVKLSDGWTNYELTGDPDAAHTVVLLHGGTIPLCIWEPQMEALGNAGFAILRYDQYGKGFSDRPAAARYSRDLYSRQLKELFDALAITKPVTLIGPSFGGAIAVTFAASHPERVRAMVLISPALGLLDSDSPLAGPIKLMRIPLIGTIAYKAVIKKKLIARAAALIPGGPASACAAAFTGQFTCKGTDKALLSMFKSDAFGEYRDETRAAGKSVKKMLLLRGKDDKEITPRMIERIKKDLPGCPFIELDGCGHAPSTEAADRLNTIIVDFISGDRE